MKTEDDFFHEDDLALFTGGSENSPKTQGLWYIDSAATRHMTFDKTQLVDYHTFPDH